MISLSRIALVIALCATQLSGCASTVAGVTKGILDKFLEPGFTSIEAALEASEDLNPDPYGAASNLVFRTYWLRSVKAFNDADYRQLKDKKIHEATLGEDLIAVEEFRINPGETRTEVRSLKKKLEEGAQVYLGVLATYRDAGNARWRASMPLEPHEENKIRIRFEASAVAVEPRDD